MRPALRIQQLSLNHKLKGIKMHKYLLLSVCGCLISFTANAFETNAKYAYLIDADTGFVMYDKKSDVVMAPASMSKLMTAYMLFEAIKNGRISMEDEFVVSDNAWRKGGVKSGSSTMFLEPNKKVKVKDLLRGIIVQSGNDACIVAAEGLAGSEETFAKLMTQKAKELGLTESTFKNATGLPHPEHLMSSRDLARLAQALIRDFPEYYPIYSEKEFTYNKIKQGNRNPLLYSMDGADGLKTGHTEASGYGLTGSIKKDGRRLIMVINGLKSMKARSEESQKLMGHGLSGFENVTVFEKDTVVDNLPVWYGEVQTVPAIPANAIVMTIERGNQKSVQTKVVYDSPIPAPIKKGQKVGQLIITADPNQTKTVDLLAGQDIEKVGYFGKLKRIVLSVFGK